MSVFEGYIFEIEKSYDINNNQYKIKTMYWFDSSKHKQIGNDGTTLLISEPIVNFNDSIKEEVINGQWDNYHLKYENEKWIIHKNL